MDETSAPVLPAILAGRYDVEREIARGGMAIVYLARDRRHDRRVAIKVLRPDLASAVAGDRFLREIDIAAHLTHPNILPIHDSGEIDGLPYYVMPYVEGGSLRARLHRSDVPLTSADVVRITLEIADALIYAHSRGLLHRDIKPENILFQAGHALIADFGIARAMEGAGTDTLTQTGVAMGTLAYMSPEQASGSKDLDARSDVYSLACVVDEMLTSANSARGRQAATAALDSVVKKGLERDPANRYDDVAQFRDAVVTASAPARWPRARLLAGAAAAVVVVGVAASVFVVWTHSRVPTKIAVLPFVNLSGDSTQDYFSDGLTEEMISQLGEVAPQRLAVIGRSSTMRYKNGAIRIDSIARELGVDYVLEGSWRRDGDRVRIAAELVRARDQTQVWAQQFDRELSDILGLQGAVAQGVTRSLALRFVSQAHRDRVDTAAYEAYLRGLEHNARLNRPDLEMALRYYERALAIDSTYVPAYAGIARAWGGLQQMGFARPAVAYQKMRAALDRGAALDSTQAALRRQIASFAVWSNWDWGTGQREFRRALALNPNDAQTLSSYAHLLMIMKRPDEAFRYIRKALDLEPFDPQVRAFYGVMLSNSHREKEALSQFREVQRIVPNMQMVLAQIPSLLEFLGDTAGALREDRAAFAIRSDTQAIRALDAGAAEGGYAGAMRRVADLLAGRSQATGTGSINVAGRYRRAGDYDRAILWLQRAVENRDPNVPYMNVARGNAALHNDPRYRALIARLRLP